MSSTNLVPRTTARSFAHPNPLKLISSFAGSDYKKTSLITRVLLNFSSQFPFQRPFIFIAPKEIPFREVKISIGLNEEEANQRVASWGTFSLPRHYPRRIKIFISFNEFLIGFLLKRHHAEFCRRIMERIFRFFDKLH